MLPKYLEKLHLPTCVQQMAYYVWPALKMLLLIDVLCSTVRKVLILIIGWNTVFEELR